MALRGRCRRATWSVALLLLAFAGAGCHAAFPQPNQITRLPPVNAPFELAKLPLPDYMIEPPDVLQIEVVQIIPLGSQRISPLDVLLIQSSESLPDQPISGPYVVAADGVVNLGAAYGTVPVAGKSNSEAKQAIEAVLSRVVRSPVVTITLLQSAAKQQITGEHLVGPDGKVNLGIYGQVFVTGLTVDQAREHIQSHLRQFLQSPEVSVDVIGYNSKTYYIITEGAGFGDGVNRFPITGNETVLDAIAQINGLSQVSSKKIWISRPYAGPDGCNQILPVDWVGITKCGTAATNYQIMPGDRIFVAQDHLIAFDSGLGKLLAPAERILGFTLLSTQTVQAINRFPKGYLTPPNTTTVVAP